MHLARHVLHNWMIYRGTNELLLQPKSYGVVARRESDPEWSNWAGKSALLESVDFVLTGRLNPDRKLGADGWISDGEREGGVLIELSDGTIAERKRKNSTQLYVTPKGGKTATKDEAQHMLDEMIGLTPDDLWVTSYFRQRKLSNFILSKPEERMNYVRAWFRLDLLESAEDSVRTKTAALSTKLDEVFAKIARLREIEKEWYGPFETLGALEQDMRFIENKLIAEKDKLSRLQGVIASNAELENAARIVREYNEVRSILNILDAEYQKLNGREIEERAERAENAVTDAHIRFANVRAELDQKSALASGKFDGHCPIGEMQCPVKDQINAQRERGEKLYADVREKEFKIRAECARLQNEKTIAVTDLANYNDLARRLRDAIGKRDAMQSVYDEAKTRSPPADVADLQERIRATQQNVSDLEGMFRERRRSFLGISDGLTTMGKLQLEASVLESELATHREALAILGKNGAQRRVAESPLRMIQGNTNAMFQECGIKLDVEILWSREGEGLAKTCDACGHPFPTSRKVRECERCHTERGPLLVNKLDIAMSEQSGGAEDLVGAGIQLAASAWLRQRRGARWSVALIDEPFGALDAVHRRAFSAHLASMLKGRYGFDQSFVIAHHASVLDSLPGRIEVINDGTKSIARIAA